MPHLSDVSHHCLDTGCAVRGSGNVCLIAEMFVLWMCVNHTVWLHDFIPKFSQSLRAPDIDRFSLRATSECRVQCSEFYNPWDLCPSCDGPVYCWWPGTPRVTPWVPPSLPECLTPEVTLATRQICPENPTSRLTVQMLLRAPHTRGEFKWLH